MVLIGLTGGIGSGKSTVSAALAARGATVIDADAIVHELQRRGTPVFDAIVDRFGSEVVGPEGELNRPALAERVFGNADELTALNAIVHPAVGLEIERRIAGAGADDVVILDVPLLVESGRDDMAGTIVVDLPPDVAVARLVEYRGFTEEDVRARMARQVSREDRLARADLVIDNAGDRADLDAQIDRAWAWISELEPSPRTPPPVA